MCNSTPRPAYYGYTHQSGYCFGDLLAEAETDVDGDIYPACYPPHGSDAIDEMDEDDGDV